MAEQLPSRDNDDWIDFLHWLIVEQNFDAVAIVGVVEKPWQYGDEYGRYLAAGGVNR